MEPTWRVINIAVNPMAQRKSQRERWSISRVVLFHRCEYWALCLIKVDTFSRKCDIMCYTWLCRHRRRWWCRGCQDLRWWWRAQYSRLEQSPATTTLSTLDLTLAVLLGVRYITECWVNGIRDLCSQLVVLLRLFKVKRWAWLGWVHENQIKRCAIHASILSNIKLSHSNTPH